MALLGAGLFGVLWATVRLTSEPFGGAIAALYAAGAALLVAFVAYQRRAREPMLDLSLFGVPTLAPSFLAALFQGVANFAVLFLVTMYLQGVRALSPLDAALLLVPGYLVGRVMGPFGGRLTDRLGAGHRGARVPGRGDPPVRPSKASPPRVFGVASGMCTFSNVGMIFSFAVALLVAARAVTQPVAFAVFVGDTSLTRVAGADFLYGIHLAFYASVAAFIVAGALSAARGVSRAAPGSVPAASRPGV